MVRIRIGAGLVLSRQLERIAQLSKQYGDGVVHVTTRQDIQIHKVPISDTSSVLEKLLEVNLSSRGGGGNTVRNVTACARAGVCPKEQFDVSPYAVATAEYLLQSESSFNLPRKYKIVFSGCRDDCSYASVADLAFFAHIRDGQKGFAAYTAGGLGPNPRVAVKIEDFVKDDEIFEVAEAVKKLFDEHGDRANKHKARLRYVLGRFGEDKFVELYKAKRKEVQNQSMQGDIPRIRDFTELYGSPGGDDSLPDLPANVTAEKTAGLVTVKVKLEHGDITAGDLVKVAKTAEKFGQGLVRTTQLQDILITSVPAENIQDILGELKSLSIDVLDNSRPKIVSCTGAATCKLGLCLSRGLAGAIADSLQEKKISLNGNAPVIRISGCPNSCGNHYIADIGFQGKAKRVNDKLMPCYEVMTEARTVEGKARLAKSIGTVPAKSIPEIMTRIFDNGQVQYDKLKALVEKHSDFSVGDFADDYFCDFGADKQFSLAGRGPGECGAGVMDVMQVDIDEAKEAVKGKGDSGRIYKAIVASARALLFTFGLEPKKDREIFAAFAEKLIKPGWVSEDSQQLIDKAVDWKMGDAESITDIYEQVRQLVERIEALFLSLDANLKFRIDPVAQKNDTGTKQEKPAGVDLRGVACPLNFVKAKLALEKVQIGDVLEILLDDGEPVRNAPASFAEQGQEIIEIRDLGKYHSVKVRRKK